MSKILNTQLIIKAVRACEKNSHFFLYFLCSQILTQTTPYMATSIHGMPISVLILGKESSS